MAQFAPVAPPNVLRSLRDLGDTIVGRYHLLLAHDVVARPHLYKDLLPDGSFVIMDNSIIELGHPVDAPTMKRALEIVPSNVVVLPDVIKDYDQTLELSFMAADQYSKFVDPAKTKYMAVPQGQTRAEIIKSALELAYIDNVGCWGIPRHITSWEGTRMDFIKWIWEKQETRLKSSRWGPFIHLLGFSENMEDDLKCSHLSGVLGIDSAVPVRMGQNKQIIQRTQQAHAPRDDWWSRASSDIQAETIANLSLVRTWLQLEIPRLAYPQLAQVQEQSQRIKEPASRLL
jgi:hypothetical protein